VNSLRRSLHYLALATKVRRDRKLFFPKLKSGLLKHPQVVFVCYDVVAASQANTNVADAVLQYSKAVEEAREQCKLSQQLVKDRQNAVLEAQKMETELGMAAAQAEVAFRDAQQEVKVLKEEIATMQGPSKHAKFGNSSMAELVSAVQAASSRKAFHVPPVGPIGHYLTLTDARWARAVESAVGLSFDTFLVQDQHDCAVLRRLIQQSGIALRDRPRICVMNLKLPMHTVPDGRQPMANLPTVLRVLRCSDRSVENAVINFLIDNARIESLALAISTGEAREVVRSRNVAQVYCADGSKYYVRGATETFEAEPAWMSKRPTRIGTSDDERRKELQKALDDAQAEARMAEAAFAEAHHLLSNASEAAKAARHALVDSRRADRPNQTRLTNLMAQPPPEVQATQASAEGDVDEVEAEVFQATQAVVDLEDQLRETMHALETAKEEELEAQRANEAAQGKNAALQVESQELLATFEVEVQQEMEARAALEVAREEHRDVQGRRAEKESQLKVAIVSLEQFLSAASQFTSREEAGEIKEKHATSLRARGKSEEVIAAFFSNDFLLKKIDRLEKKIESAEREAGGSLMDVEAEYAEAQKALQAEKARSASALELYGKLHASFRSRKIKLSEVDASIESVVSARFNQYLRKKGHCGRLHLDRMARTLTLSVQIGELRTGAGAGAVKDLKQLSGGERSFTTVAFTLALGSETDMPFRAMDEFDVFMDAVNRRIAMENLLTFAREHKELQFVFLSPQDMTAMTAAREHCAARGHPIPEDFVRIVAMRKPRPGT